MLEKKPKLTPHEGKESLWGDPNSSPDIKQHNCCHLQQEKKSNPIAGKFSISRRVKIGKDTKIYDQVNLYDCEIGNKCKIDAFVYIEGGVKIGDNCKIRCFTHIPSGVTIEDDVFVGPHVCFTNDKYPKAKGEWELLHTLIRRGASIGANSTILPGITIGENALVGAGSVVTDNIPDNAVVIGNPAQIIYINEKTK